MHRNILLDVLKIILSLMVVGLHANFLKDVNSILNFLLVNGIFRIAVPTFFIINGFYFNDVIKENRILIWLKKTIILFLIWMLLYCYFWFPPSDSNMKLYFKIILFLIGYNHLWYLSALVGSGVLLFLLRKLTTTKILISAIFLFLIGVSLQYIGNYDLFSGRLINKIFHFGPIYRNCLFFGFPFFSIGYIINKTNFYKKICQKHLMAFLAASVIVLIFESLVNYINMPKAYPFEMYISLFIVCPLLFLNSFAYSLQSKFSGKTLSLYATSIYLIHPMFNIMFFNLTSLSYVVTFLSSLFSILAGYFMIKIYNKYGWIL